MKHIILLAVSLAIYSCSYAQQNFQLPTTVTTLMTASQDCEVVIELTNLAETQSTIKLNNEFIDTVMLAESDGKNLNIRFISVSMKKGDILSGFGNKEGVNCKLNISCNSRMMTNSPTENPNIANDVEIVMNAAIFQNVPNPFDEGTLIRYFVPDASAGAQIIFYDAMGNKVKIHTIEESGAGELSFSSSHLSNGMYAYALVINGETIDMKKMILNK